MSKRKNPYAQIRKLKKSLKNKDAIIHQYQILYEESRQALKLVKNGMKSSSDSLEEIVDCKNLQNRKP